MTEYRLPPEVIEELEKAPPMMTLKEAAKYLGLSVSRVRALLHKGHLAGIKSSRGAERCIIPRAGVARLLERRHLSRS